MKVTTAVLDATRSRFWLTARTPPVRIAQPVAVADEPAAAEPDADASPSPAYAEAPRVPRPVPPGDALLAALDACSDDAQRAVLIATTSVEAREQLPAALAYREMSTLRGRNPRLGALVAALDSCANESARAALLAAMPPALLVMLAEHLRHDRCEVIAQRYMDSLVL